MGEETKVLKQFQTGSIIGDHMCMPHRRFWKLVIPTSLLNSIQIIPINSYLISRSLDTNKKEKMIIKKTQEQYLVQV